MPVFDAFVYFNELDLLEIRLRELAPVVDHFIIVEATQTFSGLPKQLSFDQNQGRFLKFADKIIHVVVDDLPNVSNPWIREEHQRNAIIRGLGKAESRDIVMISDVDEVPRREAVAEMLRLAEPTMFRQDFYYYWLNCRRFGEDYHLTRAVPVRSLQQSTPQTIRHRSMPNVIRSGGWHFSYLGGVECIRQKISAFSHQEYNNDVCLAEANLANAMHNGVDLFGRNYQYEFIPLDSTFPHAVCDDPDRYKHLVRLAPSLRQSSAPDLDRSAHHWRTDKRSGEHNYTQWYEELWHGRRGEPLAILEFGMSDGASIRMWKEYFPRADIVGIDTDAGAVSLAEPRVTVIVGRQDCEAIRQEVSAHFPDGIDIVIDDARHVASAQQKAFAMYFPLLRPKGDYVIEDLHTSYWGGYQGTSSLTTMDFLKQRLDDLMLRGESGYADRKRSRSEVKRPLNEYEEGIESVRFYRGLAVIRKASM